MKQINFFKDTKLIGEIDNLNSLVSVKEII